jgi:hypothetical protein
MAYSDGREGIGGLLLAFLIEYSIAWPLFVIATNGYVLYLTAKDLASLPSWPQMLALMIAQLVLQLGVPLFVAYRLIARRNPRTVRITIAALWCLGPVVVALNVGGALAVSHRMVRLEVIMWGIAPIVAEVLVHAGLWTLYFLRSRRVRNTYYPSAVEDELAGTFA